MLSRCRCQLVCIYMNVHMTSYRDILALIIYCLPLHPGTFEQVISWGGTYNPRADLHGSGVTRISLQGLFGARLSLSRVDSLLPQMVVLCEFPFCGSHFMFDSVGGLCFLLVAFYRLGFATAEFGGHRRSFVCLSIGRQQLVVLLGIAGFCFRFGSHQLNCCGKFERHLLLHRYRSQYSLIRVGLSTYSRCSWLQQTFQLAATLLTTGLVTI